MLGYCTCLGFHSQKSYANFCYKPSGLFLFKGLGLCWMVRSHTLSKIMNVNQGRSYIDYLWGWTICPESLNCSSVKELILKLIFCWHCLNHLPTCVSKTVLLLWIHRHTYIRATIPISMIQPPLGMKAIHLWVGQIRRCWVIQSTSQVMAWFVSHMILMLGVSQSRIESACMDATEFSVACQHNHIHKLAVCL